MRRGRVRIKLERLAIFSKGAVPIFLSGQHVAPRDMLRDGLGCGVNEATASMRAIGASFSRPFKGTRRLPVGLVTDSAS